VKRVWCIVLQRCCSVLQRDSGVAACCSVLYCVAFCVFIYTCGTSVVYLVAECCSVLHFIAVFGILCIRIYACGTGVVFVVAGPNLPLYFGT